MKVITDKLSILIIEKKDLKQKDVCHVSIGVDYVFVPKEIKEEYLLSDLRTCLIPCLKSKGKTYFYE